MVQIDSQKRWYTIYVKLRFEELLLQNQSFNTDVSGELKNSYLTALAIKTCLFIWVFSSITVSINLVFSRHLTSSMKSYILFATSFKLITLSFSILSNASMITYVFLPQFTTWLSVPSFIWHFLQFRSEYSMFLDIQWFRSGLTYDSGLFLIDM